MEVTFLFGVKGTGAENGESWGKCTEGKGTDACMSEESYDCTELGKIPLSFVSLGEDAQLQKPPYTIS